MNWNYDSKTFDFKLSEIEDQFRDSSKSEKVREIELDSMFSAFV